MIPVSHTNVQTEPWKKALQRASISLPALLEHVGLSAEAYAAPLVTNPRFKIKATKHYLDKITKGDPHDPLLRQILPLANEAELSAGFAADPVGDLSACKAPGLIQKYQGRALLLASTTCPIHCRYCFRKHFPYQEHHHLDAALEHIAKDPSIHEVILSGGDPLSLDNQKLAALFDKLEAIAQITTLRIHSRFASVLPNRFDAGLLALFARSRFKIVLVSHINHAQEINHEVIAALAPFQPVATLLNQSVLLRGVNDHAHALARLSFSVFDAGILPYYLHQLDKTQGTAHFAVPDAKAHALWQRLQAQLPGYLLPRLVREHAGKPSKTWLA